MYAVIMAGGGGTRLWPLSTPALPKPFLPLLGDQSLLQRTVARLFEDPVLGLTPADVTVVTEQRYAPLVERQLPGMRVLAEPRGRNTAAAVALATRAIERPDDEVMLVLPADHTIADESAYRRVLRLAADQLATGALGVTAPLVTLGIAAHRPATEYGYLLPDLARAQQGQLWAYVLKAFEEKPTIGRATELLRRHGTAWNAGIFLWQRGAIRAAIDRYTGLLTLLEGTLALPGMLDDAYERIAPVSIDYAVMEGAAADGQVLMAAIDVGWSDLGTWGALLDALVGGYREAARVVAPGERIEPGPADLIVLRENDRLVALAGGAGTMQSEQPMALLPAAGEHRAAIESLLARVTGQEGRA
ncbi:mannose-1-phosphate guanylyltransferase [soil metagenome]